MAVGARGPRLPGGEPRPAGAAGPRAARSLHLRHLRRRRRCRQKGTRSDIRRFEPGAPLLLGAIGGAASIELLLEIGQPRLLQEATAVSQHIEELARRRGFAVQPRTASPIVTFVPAGNAHDLAAILRDADISVGGLRLAPHAFNSTADVDRAFDLLG